MGSMGPIRFIVNEGELVPAVIDTALKSYAREGCLPVLSSDLNDFFLYCPHAGSGGSKRKNVVRALRLIKSCNCRRDPNPDTVLIIQTPKGVYSTKCLVQNKERAGSRLISSNRVKLKELSTEETIEVEPLSAARCQTFKRVNTNKKVEKLTYKSQFQEMELKRTTKQLKEKK